MQAANRKNLSIGSVQEWNDINTATRTTTTASTSTTTTTIRKLPLLDLQNHTAFHRRHIHDSFHMPLATVKQRSYELPPRQHAFAVMVPSTAAADDNIINNIDYSVDGLVDKPGTNQEKAALQFVRDFFLCLDDDDNDNPENTTKQEKKRRAQKPWKVPLVILAGDVQNWKQAADLGLLVVSDIPERQPQLQGGIKDCNAHTNVSASIPFHPLPRLWQPDSMVQTVLLPLLAERLTRLSTGGGATQTRSTHHDHSDITKDDAGYEIWDLGAGSGRDVCFLAEELKAVVTRTAVATTTMRPSFCVVGMDQRYRRAWQTGPSKQTSDQNKNTKKRPLSPNHNNYHHYHHKEAEDDNNNGTKRPDASNKSKILEQQQHHPSEGEEEECIQFWNRRRLKDVTRCASVQFGKPSEGNQHFHCFQQQQQQQQQQQKGKIRVLCLYMVRFWNQSLLEFLANHSKNDAYDDDTTVVESGTLVAVSQFAKPFAGAPWPFEHPKVRECCKHCFPCMVTHFAALYHGVLKSCHGILIRILDSIVFSTTDTILYPRRRMFWSVTR